MPHRKYSHHAAAEGSSGLTHTAHSRTPDSGAVRRLEIVLKCDSTGSIEAVVSVLSSLKVKDVEIAIIDSGVGPVSKSDLMMALTGSKFVVGFNVEVMPKLDQWVKEKGAEVRTYNVIYRLADDIKEIAGSLTFSEEEEKVTGRAKVIALFKSSHKGIIVGCEVQDGVIAVGRDFRIIAAMGPVYTGKIQSLQIEKKPIKEAKVGQQIGLKIADFSRVTLGDLVECFERVRPKRSLTWVPSGNIIHTEV